MLTRPTKWYCTENENFSVAPKVWFYCRNFQEATVSGLSVSLILVWKKIALNDVCLIVVYQFHVKIIKVFHVVDFSW